MKTIQLQCTLLSDVIISETSATTGNRHSLDFIPGNNFLGIAASKLYNEENEKTHLLFHSGKVRFGDAHPSLAGVRGVRIPAVVFRPKLKDGVDEHYFHHLLPTELSKEMGEKQLKQCREGFYVFDGEQATKVKVEKTFALKSAYDSENRCSQDHQLFGYEAMNKGLILYFEVELDDDAAQYAEELAAALCGTRHLGRSRTAQYGLVEITATSFEQLKSDAVVDCEEMLVYADGRLIFLDEHGLSTFQPTLQQLGFEGKGKILWHKSQVRTFSYAPWNFKRQAFDSQRCGIEKGSVFVVRANTAPKKYAYVGDYQQEGFGRVVYNPDILSKNKANQEGKAMFKFEEQKKTRSEEPRKEVKETPLLAYLKRAQEKDKRVFDVQKVVNEFVNKHADKFKGERFASQWGSIRSLAMVTSDAGQMERNVRNFLKHGVAEEQWNENGRRECLEEVMSTPNICLQELLINLASEMAKECKN